MSHCINFLNEMIGKKVGLVIGDGRIVGTLKSFDSEFYMLLSETEEAFLVTRRAVDIIGLAEQDAE